MHALEQSLGQAFLHQFAKNRNRLAFRPDHPDVVGQRLDRPAQHSHVIAVAARNDHDIRRFAERKLGHSLIEILDRPGAVQSTVWIGLPVADPTSADWNRIHVTDALLGGAFGSRITRNIREDKGYTYSPFSFLWSRPKTALWIEQADVTTVVTGASVKEIFGEIDKLRSEAPPATELDGMPSSRESARRPTTHPPPTVPKIEPSSRTNIFAVSNDGTDPRTFTMVAIAPRRPSRRRTTISS